MKFEITFFMVCFSMLSIGLTGCSFQTDSTDSSESVAEYNINGDESLINSENLDLFSEVAGKAEENEDTITLPIVINESGEITDSATVKLLSAKFEENEIRNFQNISQYYTTIPHYEKYFDNDGSLNSDYIFAELNIGITSQKSWDDLYLTSFNLEYIYNGQYGSCEPKFIDNCIDFEDPHKQSTVAIKADEMNEISIGYILPKEEFENIDEVYLHAQFATFSIDGSKSIKINSFDFSE